MSRLLTVPVLAGERPRGKGWRRALAAAACRRCNARIGRGDLVRYQPGYALCEVCGRAASL